MDTATEVKFADGTYRFWLPLPQIIELERKTGDKSVFAIYDELSGGLGLKDDAPVYLGGGGAHITDIRETIRLGLIGGNEGLTDAGKIEVGPLLAKQLVDDYVYPARPLIEGQHIAWQILHAAINGIQLKKKAEPAIAAKPRKRSTRAKSSPTVADSI